MAPWRDIGEKEIEKPGFQNTQSLRWTALRSLQFYSHSSFSVLLKAQKNELSWNLRPGNVGQHYTDLTWAAFMKTQGDTQEYNIIIPSDNPIEKANYLYEINRKRPKNL